LSQKSAHGCGKLARGLVFLQTLKRLLRGGSWDLYPRFCRSARRIHHEPDYAFIYVGFRVVCLPQGPSLNP
jgi:formylglycine-generating enzyme required for sulfatase activity